MLSNQFRILEALYPDEAESYALARSAIEDGYEIAYDWNTPHINPDVMTEAESKEVLDILDMYRALKDTWEALPTKPAIDEWRVKFPGFDGNREVKQLGFAYYLRKEDKFTEILGKDLNSHAPLLDRYRQMLVEWERSANKHNLTESDLIRIASA